MISYDIDTASIGRLAATLGKWNGTADFDGARYALLHNAYMCDDGERFYARAVLEDAVEDDSGAIETFIVYWTITDEYRAYVKECCEDGVSIDDSRACDWDDPDSVEPLDSTVADELRRIVRSIPSYYNVD